MGRVFGAGLIALLAMLFAACGGSSSPASTADLGFSKAAVASPPPKSATCTGATVEVGAAPGTVSFRVRCWAPAHGGTVGFSLSRSGFTGASRHPAVQGPGARTRFGSCTRRRKQIFDCEARIDGWVEISGEIRVPETTRCSRPITITVAQASSCKGPDCPAAAGVKALWSGPPRGC